MTISIIIPTLNEEARLPSAIASCRAAGLCEIVVVDGGSTDGTCDVAKAADRVIHSERGRARQLNAGAAVASGDILLFLHADCQLPESGLDSVQAVLSQSAHLAGGCFRQHINHPARKFRWIEAGNVWRARQLGWIYGDQGLFVRRNVFHDLGGFPELPLMEDLAFSKRLKRRGPMVVLADQLDVDARRWERMGVIHQTLRNWAFVLLWHGGVPADRLARWYAHIR